jgi:Polysaccharide deacetylase
MIHGVVPCWEANLSSHRLYVSAASLRAYLKRREIPYGPWGSASSADMLTVDDATRAGADACVIARQMGHEVTFFVNPANVVSGQPYFFSALDAYIDRRQRHHVHYRGTAYDLRRNTDLVRFRRTARDVIPRVAGDSQLEELALISESLQVADTPLPPHTTPISASELCRLRNLGVRIENHGWTHDEIAAMDKTQFTNHVSWGRDWLRTELSVSSHLYAVPFGLSIVPPEWRGCLSGPFFLADTGLPVGLVEVSCWNRSDITHEIRDV